MVCGGARIEGQELSRGREGVVERRSLYETGKPRGQIGMASIGTVGFQGPESFLYCLADN